jgi:hypothetical protein
MSFVSSNPSILRLFQHIEGGNGTGWAGVYRWCRLVAQEGGGKARGSIAFVQIDILIVHLDADVAGKTYREGRIIDTTPDLPCEQHCPPASATTDALRKVILRWLGETEAPPKLVFCTPSKSTGAWVLMAFFSDDEMMEEKGWECYADPDAQLAQKPKKHRIQKTREAYKAISPQLTERWAALCEKLPEAARFSRDFQELLKVPS